MIFTTPATIVRSNIVSTSAVNADPVYVPTTTYADKVKCTYADRVWLSLKAGNLGNQPGAVGSVEWWSDAGPSNDFAMFDSDVRTSTTATGTLSVTLDALTFNGIALHNITGTNLEITCLKDGNTYYTRTMSLWDTSGISNWEEYFYQPQEFISDVAFVDMPLLPSATIQLTLTNMSGGPVSVGMFVAGLVTKFDVDAEGLSRDGIDSTQLTYDKFGTAKIGEQRFARKVSASVKVDTIKSAYYLRRLDAVASKPVSVLAGDGDGTLLIYGLLTSRFEKRLKKSILNYEVKGLL